MRAITPQAQDHLTEAEAKKSAAESSLTFMETQFPVSKLSKESYTENGRRLRF